MRLVSGIWHGLQMIKEALLALKEKGGSSPYAIGKYIEEKHKAALPENFRKILGLQLKNSASKGKLIRVKASYKLSESGKKDKATTKAAPKTVAAKKQPDQAKSVAAKSASKEKPSKKSQAVKPAKKSEAVKKTKAKAPAAAAAAAAARSKAKAVQKTKKRAAPAKAKAKQPKSIKSSPAKKAKKAAA